MKRNNTLNPVFRSPVTTDGPLLEINDAAAVIFRNAGTATVQFNNGAYTLDSKETLSLNVTEENSAIDVLNFTVSFDTSTGSDKKLQILIIKAASC